MRLPLSEPALPDNGWKVKLGAILGIGVALGVATLLTGSVAVLFWASMTPCALICRCAVPAVSRTSAAPSEIAETVRLCGAQGQNPHGWCVVRHQRLLHESTECGEPQSICDH